MTTLDVALRLRLLNQLSPEAAKAARDLLSLKSAAGGVNGRGPDKLKRDIIDVSTASRQADRSLRELRRETDALGRARGPDRLKRDMLDMASAARQAERSMAGARKAATGLRDARGRLARPGADAAMAGGRIPIVAGSPGTLARFGAGYMGYRTASGAFTTSVDQEKAWAEVLKKVDASPAEYAQMERTLRKMARTYGLGISETFSQAAEAGAAGIDKADIEEFVKLTTRASVGWDMTARETAQKIAEIKSGTGATLPWIEDLADKINALGDNSAAKERDIVEMFHRSGAAAKEAGVDYDATLAILTAVRSTGMQEEVASRWFNAFAAGLAGAHAKSKKAQEGFKQLGLDPKGVAKGMTTDSVGTILKVFEALEKAPQMDKIAAATKIFGEGWWDETARAGKALPEIIRLLKFIREPANWKGSLDKSLNIQLATTANHLERLKTLASEVGDRISRWALPAVNSKIEKLIKKLDEWDERAQRKEQERRAAAEAQGEDPDPPKTAEDYWGRDLRRRHRKELEEVDGKVALAERDLAAAEATAKLRKGLGRDPGDARRKVERLRMQREEMRLQIEALKPTPDLPPELWPYAGAPRRPADLDDWIKEHTEGKTPPPIPVPRPHPLKPIFPPAAPLDHVAPRGAEDATRKAMERVTEAIASEGERAVAQSKSIADRIKEAFSFVVNFTIRPNLSGPGASVGDNSELPKPQSLRNGPAGGSGRVVIQNAHFHGVNDVAAFGRQLARLQDEAVTGSRDGALHDTWSYA